MSRILIAYTTNAGSTEETAEIIAEPFLECGDQVDIRRIDAIKTIDGYDAVVVGAPMILGWHGAARRFLRRHREALSRVPTAYFCTAMMLTQTNGKDALPAAVCIDPGLAKPPQKAGRLTIKERYSLVENYLRPMLKASPGVQPVSVAFFGGKLELFRLKLLQMLFVLLIIRAQPGDLRDKALMRQWAADTRSLLLNNLPK
jgi:menaquinone-dependent protoporphyrinogen IX oxidase